MSNIMVITTDDFRQILPFRFGAIFIIVIPPASSSIVMIAPASPAFPSSCSWPQFGADLNICFRDIHNFSSSTSTWSA
jgi:hypothetical protein